MTEGVGAIITSAGGNTGIEDGFEEKLSTETVSKEEIKET
jgi:hypothetical protein